MKTLIKKIIILGILGGIGYFIYTKALCKKNDCSCKKSV